MNTKKPLQMWKGFNILFFDEAYIILTSKHANIKTKTVLLHTKSKTI